MPVRHAGQLRAGLLRSRAGLGPVTEDQGTPGPARPWGHLHAGCRKESPCFPREQCSPGPFHKEVDKNAWKMKPPPSATRCNEDAEPPGSQEVQGKNSEAQGRAAAQTVWFCELETLRNVLVSRRPEVQKEGSRREPSG